MSDIKLILTPDQAPKVFFRSVSAFMASSTRRGGSLSAIARARTSFGLSARRGYLRSVASARSG